MLYLLFLYCSLADPSYETREAATDRLCELVSGRPWFYGPRLAELAREASEPEVRFRVRRPIMVYDRWRVNGYVPSTVPVWPSCDCLPMPMMFGDARAKLMGNVWHDYSANLTHKEAPYWHSYRRGTEKMIRHMLQEGATAAECDQLLSRMWTIEKAANGDSKPEQWKESETWTKWEGGYPQPK